MAACATKLAARDRVRQDVARDFNELAGDDYLAVIVIDGDSLGRRLHDQSTPAEYEDFSVNVKACIRRAMSAGNIRCQSAQVDVLYQGGDDIVIACPSRWALPFAEAFSASLAKEDWTWAGGDDRRIGFSIGIAVTHSGFPFRVAHDVAICLLRNAKRRAKHRLWAEGAIDFAIVTEAFGEADSILHERQIGDDDYRQLLPGSELSIVVQAEQLSEQEIEWLAAALKIIATGQVGLGGRTARGNGFLAPVASACRVAKRELHRPGQLLDCALCSRNDDRSWRTVGSSLDEFPGRSLTLPNRIFISFHMAPPPNGTMLIADPVRAASSGFDAAQRTLGDNPEIPGSSLAGVLRSGTERIVRTLGGRVCDLMHESCEPDEENVPVSNDSWCCLPCRLFGNEGWASRLGVRVTTLGKSRGMPFDHVAIDRFTGGASDQKKFDALAVMDGMYKVEMTIDRVRTRTEAQWMIGLVALVLRDLHEGRLWIGSGGSKGHGLVELPGEPCWELPAEWKDLPEDLQSCVDTLWQTVKGA